MGYRFSRATRAASPGDSESSDALVALREMQLAKVPKHLWPLLMAATEVPGIFHFFCFLPDLRMIRPGIQRPVNVKPFKKKKKTYQNGYKQLQT